jgi:type VI protein secretion system component VasF
VLLIALWARSYMKCESLSFNGGHRIASLGGSLFLDGNFVVLSGKLTASHRRMFGNELQYVTTDWSKVRARAGSGLQVPYWIVVFATLTLSTPFWVRWRFSLRTLLIITTLVAVALGAIVYAVR